ncbi:MAG: cation:proton antiporter [Aggregatilineales bacterium]
MNLTDLALYVALPLLTVAIVLTLIRLGKGPQMPDRVVAFDLLSTLGIGILAVYAIGTNQPAFLDVATFLALISFLGTIAFAYYLEKRD